MASLYLITLLQMLIAFMFVFLDPYAVVGFGTQSQLTRVLDKTLSPMWDQTLIFDEITLYGPAELVAQNPPEVVIEVFDKDLIVSLASAILVLFTGTFFHCLLCNSRLWAFLLTDRLKES